jgi:transposase
MPVRELNRNQTWLLPPTLDELIPDDHPVRFVATVVDNLDKEVWEKLDVELGGDPLGAPAYNPRGLLSVWLYGFMTRMRSSRKLEAACRDQMPYLWLTAWQHPDHNTLWRFYKAHRNEMRELFKLTVTTAVKMGLVDMAVQAVDGTKIAANAAKERTYDRKQLGKLLERTDKAIQELEKENKAGSDPAPVHLPEKLRRAEKLRSEVKAAIKELEEDQKKRVNLTDSDANLMKSRHGIIAGYNVEAVVSPLKTEEGEPKRVLMTAVDAVRDAADSYQLVPMLEQAEETMGKKAEVTLADAGFHSSANLAVCEERKQSVVMPERQDRELQNPYHKDKFIYDEANDSYLCPQGQTLRFVGKKLARNTMMRCYLGSAAICRKCVAFGACTRNRRHGKGLQIGEHEWVLRRHREWMCTNEAQKAYERRKELIEAPFGIIKEVMGIRQFLLRGWTNVRAEAVTMATALNLRTLYAVWRSWSFGKRGEFSRAIRGYTGQ